MDASADTAAWVAVGIATLAIIITLVLFVVGQRADRTLYRKTVEDSKRQYEQSKWDAAVERTKLYDITTLTRILEYLTNPAGKLSIPVELIDSLIDTLSEEVGSDVDKLRDVFNAGGMDNVRNQMWAKKDELRIELQIAIVDAVGR